MKIRIICTGGTIDSYYDVDVCGAVCLDSTILPEFLESHVAMDMENVVFDELCMKDSREINDDDRSKMVEIIENSSESAFIITHGTFTLAETARYIQKNLKRKDVKVTLTGSLIPLKGFAPTDAGFNLGASLVNSYINKNGVYVCIKGDIYDPNDEIDLH